MVIGVLLVLEETFCIVLTIRMDVDWQVRNVRPMPLSDMADLFNSLHIGVAPGLVSYSSPSLASFILSSEQINSRFGVVLLRSNAVIHRLCIN